MKNKNKVNVKIGRKIFKRNQIIILNKKFKRLHKEWFEKGMLQFVDIDRSEGQKYPIEYLTENEEEKGKS